MLTLRFAVIGLGAFGRRHAVALRSLAGVELVAAVDPRGAAAPELGGLPVLRSLDGLLERELDAAIVAVP
ncbi:MAG: Gfo/Idh/MocA family oxidoreductase, partial [Myxococcales bacterium]|nr:Gfo/Idh/MocA family oxidoreductase [Myxococcales bacterium]